MNEEKKYILSMKDVRAINDMIIPFDVWEFLQGREYHERTCHQVDEVIDSYLANNENEITKTNVVIHKCSQCGTPRLSGNYCKHCGARVVKQ